MKHRDINLAVRSEAAVFWVESRRTVLLLLRTQIKNSLMSHGMTISSYTNFYFIYCVAEHGQGLVNNNVCDLYAAASSKVTFRLYISFCLCDFNK